MVSKLDAALQLAAAGFYLFPMRFIDGKKIPAIKGWPEKATTDPEQIRKWFGSGDLNVAIATEPSRLIVFDTDQKNGVDGDANLRAALGANAAILDTLLTVRTPTGSRHYYTRGDAVRNSASLIAPGVDIRSKGGYVVAPGAISDKGRYKVEHAAKLSDIPQCMVDLIAKAYVKAERVELEVAVDLDTPAAQAQAIAYLSTAAPSIQGQGGNANAYHIACELRDRGISEDMALDCMDFYSDWNERCVPEWPRDELAAVVANAYRYAENSPGAKSIELEYGDLDLTVWDAAEPEEEQPRAKIVFLTDDEIKSGKGKRREYVIKGVLAKGDLAAIIGHPGVGKSLIAPYIGRRVAQGDLAFGRRTRKGGVFYVAVEDPTGMTERVEALQLAFGAAPGFELVCGVSNLAMKNSPDLKVLLEAVKERRPVLTIIDTLAMAFPGIDENSAEGMGRVLAVGKMLARYGTAVIYIHHDTKSGGDSGRGHGSFDGALDMRLYLTRAEGSDIISGKQGKNRNGPSDWEPAFRIGVSELGIDEDGDAITAAFAKEAAAGEGKGKKTMLPRQARVALKILNDLGAIGINIDAWREECLKPITGVSASDNIESRNKAVKRAIECLQDNGLIEIKGNAVSAAGAVEDFDEEPFPSSP